MPAPDRRPTSCWRASSSAAGALRHNRFRHEPISMSQAPKPRGLGRGLSALLGDDDVASAVAPPHAPQGPVPQAPAAPARPAANRTPITLPIGQLRPGKYQPRTTFEGLD